MANMKGIIEGMQILSKYVPGDAYCAAEHDVLYLPGPEPEKLSDVDRERLQELGIRWDKGLDSWAVFT